MSSQIFLVTDCPYCRGDDANPATCTCFYAWCGVDGCSSEPLHDDPKAVTEDEEEEDDEGPLFGGFRSID